MGAQNTAARPMISDSVPRPRMVEMAAASRSPGMARPRSVKRISTDPAKCLLLAASSPTSTPATVAMATADSAVSIVRPPA